MTVRGLVTGLLGVVLLTAAFFGGDIYGASTRLSKDEVFLKVSSAVDARAKSDATDKLEAVAATKSTQRKKWIKRMKGAVKTAKKKAYDSGYSAGNTAGYSAGNSAGYTAGSEDGLQKGIDKASDELTCSDDSDVDLPPCFDY